MGRVYVITSGKGGVGKTTTTAALGEALAALGKTVALVDADSGLSNLDAALGLENRVGYTVRDVIEGISTLERAMVRDWKRPGLSLLPGASSADGVTREEMKKLTKMLAQRYDAVLVDCPAGIENGFYCAIAGAHAGIVVASPDVTALRDACKAASLLEEASIPARLLVTRLQRRLVRQGGMIPVEDMVQISGLPLLGVVPEDREVVAAGNRGHGLDRRRRAGKSYADMASVLAAELGEFSEKSGTA